MYNSTINKKYINDTSLISVVGYFIICFFIISIVLCKCVKENSKN